MPKKKQSEESPPRGVSRAVLKNLGTGVQEEMDAMDADTLGAAILEAESTIQNTTAEMGEDEKLAGAKEIVKDLASGYRDVIKAQRAKVTYAVSRLQEMGKI